jgi:hypothetical protein
MNISSRTTDDNIYETHNQFAKYANFQVVVRQILDKIKTPNAVISTFGATIIDLTT